MKSVITWVAGTFCVLAGFLSTAAVAEGAYYVCADKTELTATFHTSPGPADLVFGGSKEKISLPQVLSADGGRYAAGDTEFWIKGKNATLTRGQSKTTCKS